MPLGFIFGFGGTLSWGGGGGMQQHPPLPTRAGWCPFRTGEGILPTRQFIYAD